MVPKATAQFNTVAKELRLCKSVTLGLNFRLEVELQTWFLLAATFLALSPGLQSNNNNSSPLGLR
jgi:hypothetical protein